MSQEIYFFLRYETKEISSCCVSLVNFQSTLHHNNSLKLANLDFSNVLIKNVFNVNRIGFFSTFDHEVKVNEILK